MPQISKRVARMHGSPIRRIATMLAKAAGDKEIISFGGGAPGLAPPKEVVNYLVEKLRKEPRKTTAYGSTIGLPNVLKLIAQNLKEDEKIKIDAEKELTVTVGGTEALYDTLSAIIDPGDEVIISDPTYLMYQPMIDLHDGKAVSIPCRWKEDFQMMPDKVAEKINRKTKAIILLNPDNPTGRVQSKENVRGLVELAEDKDLWLITDDIYKYLIYGGKKFVNSRTFGGYDNTITCCSFSKTCSIPGMRVGYAYGPAGIIDRIEKMEQYTSLCPSKASQFMVEKFLENHAAVQKRYLKNVVVPFYTKGRDTMEKALKEYLPDAGFHTPHAAFYFFPDMKTYLKKKKLDDVKLSEILFQKKKLAVVPGRFFGNYGKGHVRMTYASEPPERIMQGMKRVGEFFS